MRNFTIFSVPKHFHGHTGAIQRNAILSWSRIKPRPRIILIGDEVGTVEMAREIGALHIPEIVKNIWNTPLLDDAFRKAEEHCGTDLMAFVCSDTLLDSSFAHAYKSLACTFGQFLMVGTAKFNDKDSSKSRYFAFRKGLWGNIPSIALGRPQWGDWLICEAMLKDVAVVDASEAINAVHQYHDSTHSLWGTDEKMNKSFEAKENRDATVITQDQPWLPAVQYKMRKDRSLDRLFPSPEAKELLSQSLQSRKKALLSQSSVLRDQALVLDKEGRSETALERIRTALDICPQLPGGHLVEAICLINLLRPEEAKAAASQHLNQPEYDSGARQLMALADSEIERIRAEMRGS